MRELSLEMAMSRRAPMAGSPDARLWPARIDCPWMRFGTFLRLDETSIGSVPSTVRKWALGSQWARFHAADTHRQVFAVLTKTLPPLPGLLTCWPGEVSRCLGRSEAAAPDVLTYDLWSHNNPSVPQPQLIPLPFSAPAPTIQVAGCTTDTTKAAAPRAPPPTTVNTRYHPAALRPRTFETAPSDYFPNWLDSIASSPVLLPGLVALPHPPATTVQQGPPWAVACRLAGTVEVPPGSPGKVSHISHGRRLPERVRRRWVQHRQPLCRRAHRQPRRRHGFNRSHSSWFSILQHTLCRKLTSRPRHSLDVHLAHRCRRLQPAALPCFPNRSFLGLPSNPTVRRDHRSQPLWSGTELGGARLPEPGRASATHPREPRPASERATAPPTRTISPARYRFQLA